MKKILLLLIMVLTITLSACGEDIPAEEKNFKDAMSSLELEDSVTIKTTLKDFPVIGDVESLIKIQGDAVEMIIFDESLYMVNEDDVMYMLIEANGVYTKEVADEEDQDVVNTDLGLNYEDFTFEDGVYKANVVIEDMVDLELVITDGVLVSMTFTAEIPDLNISVVTVMEFVDYGNTTVTLPAYE